MRKANFVENVRELTIAVLTGTTDIEGYNKYIASKNVSSFFCCLFYVCFLFFFRFFAFVCSLRKSFTVLWSQN